MVDAQCQSYHDVNIISIPTSGLLHRCLPQLWWYDRHIGHHYVQLLLQTWPWLNYHEILYNNPRDQNYLFDKINPFMLFQIASHYFYKQFNVLNTFHIWIGHKSHPPKVCITDRFWYHFSNRNRSQSINNRFRPKVI